jgi:aminoglycoside phosphotransferase (APT) family kinase protein
MWLVLEDAGDIEPSLESPVSRTLLTEWAARLHVEGARPRRRGLPNVGPRSFTRRLADAESRVRRRLANGRLDEHDRHVLARCAERCGELKALWPQIEETCSVFPRTIVHGDLVEKNLRLKASSAGPRLVPLDWEKAGWGVPAVDLVSVDPELYWERTSTWLGRTRAELDRLVIVGRIFTVLSRCWTETSIHEADRAEALLGRLLADAGWCG